MRTLMTGATGMIGRKLLERIDQPVVLSRSLEVARKQLGDVEVHPWNPGFPVPAAALEGCEAVIHLAGEPVAGGRWSDQRKKRIFESRVAGTRSLVSSIETMKTPPRVLVSASAVGFYGDRGDEILEESSAAGEGFLSEVCVEWEKEVARASSCGVRTVSLRFGVVLAREGGALKKMLPPFRLGVGGKLGDGRQWMPWVHIDDVIGLILEANRNESVRGPVNVVSPGLVRNDEFTRELARVLHRPAIFPVPAVALRMLFGEMSSILIGSHRVVPAVAERVGYSFAYTTLGTALSDLLVER